MKLRILQYLILFSVSLLAFSCADNELFESSDPVVVPPVPEGKARINLYTNVDYFQKPTSRAAIDEDKVNNLPWVFVFNNITSPSNTTFKEVKQAELIDGKTVVELSESTTAVRVLVVANAPATFWNRSTLAHVAFDETNLTTALTGKDYATAVNTILYSPKLLAPLTASPYDGDYLPMSGKYDLTSVASDGNIGTTETPVALTRIVAKTTVINSQSDFTVEGLGAINTRACGRLYQEGSTLPNTTDTGKMNYINSSDEIIAVIDAANNVDNALYLYESAAADGVALILKGKHGASASKYYKLQFRSSADGKVVDIKRNHWYKFKISYLSESMGYDNVTGAISGNFANAELIIEDMNVHDIVSNGKFYLGVSNSEFIHFGDVIDREEYIDLMSNTNKHNPINPEKHVITTVYTDAEAVGITDISIHAEVGGKSVNPGDIDIRINDINGVSIDPSNPIIPIPGTSFDLCLFSIKDYIAEFSLRIKIEDTTGSGFIEKVVACSLKPYLTPRGGAYLLGNDYVNAKVKDGKGNASDNWLTLSTSDTGTGVTEITHGDSPSSVYLKFTQNASTVAYTENLTDNMGTKFYNWVRDRRRRNAEVFLFRANGKGRTKVTADQTYLSYQMTNVDVGKPTVAYASKNYIGAFWRHDQRGERLITLPARGESKKVGRGEAGKWKAKVIKGDFIVLDTQESRPDKVGSEIEINEAEANLVSGSSKEVSGTAVMGNADNDGTPIYFRIGLTSTLASEDTEPRYGIIEIQYNDYSKTSRMYIRQGEKAVNMIVGSFRTPGDIRIPAGFSPYNITATKDADILAVRDAGLSGFKPSGGVTFTQFPSQIGYLFKWGGTTAYYPFTTLPTGTWTDTRGPINSSTGQATLQTPCPTGWLTLDHGRDIYPLLDRGTTSEKKLSYTEYGYYADGYTDRLKKFNIGTLNGMSLGTITYFPPQTAAQYNNPTERQTASMFFSTPPVIIEVEPNKPEIRLIGDRIPIVEFTNNNHLLFTVIGGSQRVNPTLVSHSYYSGLASSGYKGATMVFRCVKTPVPYKNPANP